VRGDDYYKGSYPFLAKHGGDNDNSKRMGYFSKTDGRTEYYENHVD
jgi:hypothetical protein